jgi:glycine betaine/proline transport system ATP-binding protein
MKLGSHISIMEAGRIVQYGEPEDIVLNPSNEYVADFVAHMNPLNVLTGTSLMTPVAAIPRCDDRILLDRTRRVVMALDAGGAPRGVTIVDRPGRIVSYADGFDLSALERDMVVTAPPEIRLRSALEIRHRTGNPLALVADGKLVGVVGDDEIYRGILRQTGIAG